MILTVEVGGSSIQAIQFDNHEHGMVVSLDQHRADRWLLAAPGLVEGDRVQGAHHLRWMDIQASQELGMLSPPLFSMNDAEAAALGEWLLHGRPDGAWLYISMGTGIGAVALAAGTLIPVEFGHLIGFGPNRCGGCGRGGCLDAQIGAHALPTPLGNSDIRAVIDCLSIAIKRQEIAIDQIVVGGGLARNYPQLVSGLNEHVKPTVRPSRAPAGYKSAAPFGLLEAWRTRSNVPR